MAISWGVAVLLRMLRRFVCDDTPGCCDRSHL